MPSFASRFVVKRRREADCDRSIAVTVLTDRFMSVLEDRYTSLHLSRDETNTISIYFRRLVY